MSVLVFVFGSRLRQPGSMGECPLWFIPSPCGCHPSVRWPPRCAIVLLMRARTAPVRQLRSAPFGKAQSCSLSVAGDPRWALDLECNCCLNCNHKENCSLLGIRRKLLHGQALAKLCPLHGLCYSGRSGGGWQYTPAVCQRIFVQLTACHVQRRD